MGTIPRTGFIHPTREEVEKGVTYVLDQYERPIDPKRVASMMLKTLQVLHGHALPYDPGEEPFDGAIDTALREHGLDEPSLEQAMARSALHKAFEDRRNAGLQRARAAAKPGCAKPKKRRKPAKRQEQDDLPEIYFRALPFKIAVRLDVRNLQRIELERERELAGLEEKYDLM